MLQELRKMLTLLASVGEDVLAGMHKAGSQEKNFRKREQIKNKMN